MAKFTSYEKFQAKWWFGCIWLPPFLVCIDWCPCIPTFGHLKLALGHPKFTLDISKVKDWYKSVKKEDNIVSAMYCCDNKIAWKVARYNVRVVGWKINMKCKTWQWKNARKNRWPFKPSIIQNEVLLCMTSVTTEKWCTVALYTCMFNKILKTSLFQLCTKIVLQVGLA